ncbi:MAG TPA: cation:proton antiporter [Anaerolineaceae bacterium]|nr:cation:proton antiporter [Anaerolineaceae bacterium]
MTAFLQICTTLAILLFAAKAFGYLSTRFNQPSVLGELIIGIILGPSLINIFNIPFLNYEELPFFINEFAEIGVLLLMFIAGLELHLSDLATNKAASAYAGILGVLVPVLFGFLVGEMFSMDIEHSLFLGLTLGATSVSISAQTLIELRMLRSRVGFGLLGAAVFDDMLVILLLSGFIALHIGGSIFEILIVIVKMFAFLVASLAFGYWVLPKITRKIQNLPITQGSITLALVVIFVYGISAEILGGMAAITGSFIAGLMYARTSEKKDIERGFRSLAYGLFVPIFFINIGLHIDIHDMGISSLWILLVISLVAILGKIIGSGLGAKLGRFNWKESLQLGIGMVSRGEVGLIVATVGLQENLLTPDLYSTIVGMVLITTLITPPLLRASFSKGNPKQTSQI